MPRVAPTHSVKPGTANVHHDNSGCTERNNIEPHYLRSGTGGRRLCDHCDRLDRAGQ
jgi:hypothetical protein